VFAGRAPYKEHLTRLAQADLFLDSLPFAAGTTASDALWAGALLLTCAGETFAARMAGSLLTAIGLPELVTHDGAGYEALAIDLAHDKGRHRELRARLIHNRDTSAVFDTARFCSHLESAYGFMWKRYRRGEPPATFKVRAVSSRPEHNTARL
jgi:predicted O-linked N-acetylglucosamine transferase (SPINDLY family)